jgi:parallel beta-helix repeat protein
MFAANYAVGTCKPSLPSFATISAAVSTVPPNSTVMVCPGTYPEQVTIAQPLTLKGITSGNAGQAVITVPGSGLTGASDAFGVTIFAMLTANGGLSGPVNITDISVDGTGNGIDCNSGANWLVGIYYPTDSSGTVNEVSVHTLATTSCGTGTGVWLENADTSNTTSITIENSSLRDIQNSAVITEGGNLLATVKGNTMATRGYSVQLFVGGSFTGNVITGNGAYYPSLSGPSAISANTVTNTGYGMYVAGPANAVVTGNTVINSTTVGIFLVAPVTASHNNVANSPYGIVGFNGATATSNRISNTSVSGIFDEGGGNTYKSNAITEAGVGIEFNCNSPSVVGNTINDATTGLDNVPLSFSSANSFDNVATLRTDGCGFGPIHGPALPAAHSGPIPVPAS